MFRNKLIVNVLNSSVKGSQIIDEGSGGRASRVGFLVTVMAHIVLLYTRIINTRNEVGWYPASLL